MRWRGREQSSNIEDRRRMGGKTAAAGAGGIGVLLIIIVMGLLGVDIRPLLQQQQRAAQPRAGGGAVVGAGEELPPEEVALGEFVAVILKDTEDVWNQLYPRMTGRPYEEPRLELFRASTTSACGPATSAAGPFYCPGDKKVYLDTAFFYQLAEELNAPGDFAQAYVIAHEVGHHVQNLLGTTGKVDQIRRTRSEKEYNKYSVMLELQADFYAGVVFHHAQRNKDILEPGDIEEGLRAASAIGDDTLQERAGRRANQETFTHGSSDQRVYWFKKGLQTGDPGQGDTFNAADL